MEWFKMESRYYDDPAVVAAGEKAEVLFLRSIAYATDFETLGFIPAHQLPRFGLSGAKARVDALVKADLWAVVEGGWQIKSYERIQAEIMTILRRRKADRDRKRAERSSRQSPGVSVDTSAGHSTGQSVSCPRNRVSISGYETLGQVETEKEKKNPPTPASGGGRACTRHSRPRRGCTACETPANPTVDLGPQCGACNPQRWIEDDDGNPIRRCPTCHPSARTA